MASELKNALKDSKLNKSPGCDGLSTEFFVIFFTKINEVLLEAINFSYEKGELFGSALRGVITLIPKKSRDTRILKHNRPISLLCTDYKLVEKMMANRMKPVLHSIIHQNQTGFMKDRRISSNIRCVLDILNYVETGEDEGGIIMSIDFEKAFDKIETRSLISALKFFDFSDDFCKWTQILYNGAKSCVMNNGNSSEWFEVTRSVKQGGPCSAYFFLVVAEIMAIRLRGNSRIHGFEIGEFKRIFGQFADDTDLYLKNDRDSLNNVIAELDSFCKQSGCTINYDKTTVYRMGSAKKGDASKYTKHKMLVVDSEINVLGVWVCSDDKKLNELNYTPMLEKIKGILMKWRSRQLSLFGKITVINTLIASLMVYKMSVLPSLNTAFVKKFNDIITKFIWNDRRPKIALKKLQANKKVGGAGLVNIETKDDSMKIAWIPFLMENDDVAGIAYEAIGNKIGNDIWRCNINTKDVKATFKRGFWTDALIAWTKLNFEHKDEIIKVENQLLWFNTHLRISDKPFLFKKAYNEGLLYIAQIFDTNGDIIPFETLCPMFQLTTMQYNSLLEAIPKEWIKVIKEEARKFDYDHKDNVDKIICKRKPSRWYYQCVTCTDTPAFDSYVKWQSKLQSPLSYSEFLKCIANIKVHSNYVKLHSFQFRIMYNAIILNDKLKNWKIVSNDMCTLCGEHKETIIHFFCECKEIKKLYIYVQNYLKIECNNNDEIELDKWKILFNAVHPNKKHIANSLILIAKHYAYVTRCKKQRVTVSGLFEMIENCKRCELYNAKQTKKLDKHIIKWFGAKKESMNVLMLYDNPDYLNEYLLELSVQNFCNQ